MNQAPLLSNRRPGCPAAADLDAHAAGDLPALGDHVAACPHCGPYVASLREELGAFLRARPSDRFLSQLARRQASQEVETRRRSPWPRLFGFLTPVVAAAALVLVLLRPGAPTPGGGEVTLKGERLRVFARRGADEPRPLGPDAAVRAGDALRFAYDAPADGYLAILDLDGTDAVTVFYPYQGSAAAPVKKGAGLLPGTVVLDDKPGPEWIVAVSAPTAFDLAQVSAQLRGQATRDRLTVTCEGCEVSSLRLLKSPPQGPPRTQ